MVHARVEIQRQEIYKDIQRDIHIKIGTQIGLGT
jgi:hypothetical protein